MTVSQALYSPSLQRNIPHHARPISTLQSKSKEPLDHLHPDHRLGCGRECQEQSRRQYLVCSVEFHAGRHDQNFFQCSAPFAFEICKIRNAQRSIMLDGKSLNSIGQIPFVKRAPLGFCHPFIGFCQIRITIDRARAWRCSLMQEILRKFGLSFNSAAPPAPRCAITRATPKSSYAYLIAASKSVSKGSLLNFLDI